MSSTLLTENMSRLWASMIASELVKLGAEHVFIAPGMRNAPLIAGFKAQQELELHVGMDERALAYQALGYAKASGKPGILLCTSGTAAANFYPAVIEANKANVPLVIISADRPLELAQTDANQTINQKHLFGNYTKHFIDLGAPDYAVRPRALMRLCGHAYETAKRSPLGPVQINIAFREPLDGKKVQLNSDYVSEAQDLCDKENSTHQQIGKKTSSADELVSLLKSAKKPLVVIGDLNLQQVELKREHLLTSLRACKHPLNIDITSSLKSSFTLGDGLVPTFDHPEVFEHFNANTPDLIIHFGGRLTSKHYYRLLNEKHDRLTVVHVNDTQALSDSGHSVTHMMNANPIEMIMALKEAWSGEKESTSAFSPFIAKKIEVIENSDKLAFPYISKRLMEMLPDNHALAIGNSTLIRSFDSYASLAHAKAVNILTHRGVSGIEGFFASSTGCAMALETPLTLALGDVSAIHDLNSLELVSRSKQPIVCVVVNNYGGGIFTLLNLEKGEELYPIITSPHERKLSPVAQAFGLKTWQAYDRSEFEQSYQEALQSKQSAFIEVFVDNNANNSIYQQLRTIKLS